MTAEQLRLRDIEFVSCCYDGKELVDAQLARTEVLQLDPAADDFHWNEAFGRVSIRTEAGDMVEYPTEIPGVGQVTRKLLTALMSRPGEFLSPQRIAAITGYRWFLSRVNLAGRLAALRRAFKDDARKPRFFLTRRHPYAIAWCAARTWSHIEPVAVSVNGDQAGISDGH